MPSGDYKVAFRARIGGEVITQFWENASDFDSSTVIALTPSEQRTGINGILQRTPAPVLESSVPTVLGSARFGDVLSVAPGQWTEGTTFIYQWFADDAPINGATSASLALSAGEVGKQISVVVTGSKEGYSSVTRTAVSTAPVAPLMLTAAMPTISGTISVGSTITAKPGAWTEGTAFSYQWFADGHAISGATGSTYVITSAQVGKKLTVRVAGALTSYASVSVMSAATKAVVNPALSASVPTISGTVAVGSTVTAKPGTWTSATTFSYQWLADGVALSEATKATFVLTAAQKDKAIAVAVTGMKPGYATASKTSAKTAKVKTGTLSVATPTISGTVASGSTLTAKPGTWTSGTSFTYQWYADGKAISKATKSTVKLAAGQKAKKITVKVTGKKSGYTTVAKTSKASAKVVTVATPTISGTKTVGKTLTAKPGTWTSRTTFSYQWYANGKAISKATKSTLKLTTSHKGKAITVKVTGKKSGYATVAKTSEATAKVR